MAVLNAQDVARIEAAIAAAEASSAGEVVVAVVGRSARYNLGRGLSAVSATLAALVACHGIWPAIDLFTLLLAQPAGWAVAWGICGRTWCLRRIAGRMAMARAVERRAHQMFYEQEIFRTRDQTGLLVMISELERRVIILGDRGLDARVGQGGWAVYCERVVAGLRGGHTCQALLSVLHDLGMVLAQQLPPRPDDVDELPNRVIIAPS